MKAGGSKDFYCRLQYVKIPPPTWSLLFQGCPSRVGVWLECCDFSASMFLPLMNPGNAEDSEDYLVVPLFFCLKQEAKHHCQQAANYFGSRMRLGGSGSARASKKHLKKSYVLVRRACIRMNSCCPALQDHHLYAPLEYDTYTYPSLFWHRFEHMLPRPSKGSKKRNPPKYEPTTTLRKLGDY